MKAVFYFWYNRCKVEVKLAAWIGLMEMILAVMFWLVIWLNVGNCKWVETWGTFLAILAALCIMAGVGFAAIILPEWVSDVRLAVRFKRLFGFYPPSTAEGRNALQPRVDLGLKRRAIILEDAYAVEEGALHQIVGLQASEYDIAMCERNLNEVKEFSQKCKKRFYLQRDTAAQAYFKAPRSFKECLK